MGFGMKVAVLPASHAVFLTMYLYFITLSAAFSSESNLVAISHCPAVPTSWWARSMTRPASWRCRTMRSRRSPKWSTGATGK